MHIRILFIHLCLLSLLSCAEKKQQELTPWGEPLKGDTADAKGGFTLDDIQTGGEMIMLTVSGPDTYFDYHGRGMGTQ